ncbi:hypothetical protein B0J14DRAFT_668956 [Halenospora varia]|nr:hypothetical protein B0J14DRAFT_668956 [Halenospora varia]
MLPGATCIEEQLPRSWLLAHNSSAEVAPQHMLPGATCIEEELPRSWLLAHNSSAEVAPQHMLPGATCNEEQLPRSWLLDADLQIFFISIHYAADPHILKNDHRLTST